MTTPTLTTFAMPSLGADMDEGRITEWLVRPGDHVRRGQIVVVVETDKSDIEVEVFEAATVTELLVDEGEVVPVGTPIARLRPDRGDALVAGKATSAPTERTPAKRAPAKRTPAAPRRPATTTAPASTTGPAPAGAATTEPPPGRGGRPGVPRRLTSPVIRHLAEELHVDTAQVRGTGPGGRVVRTDVERAGHRASGPRITPRARRLIADHGLALDRFAGQELVTGDTVLAAARTADEAGASRRRQESMRRHIADLMTRSWHDIPHYHVAQRLDLTAVIARLAATNERRPLPDRIVPGALLLCAAARAAAKVPLCNGWWHDGRFVPSDTVDLGLVLSLRTGGIIVPTIQHADELSPAEMMARMTELVQRARQGRLRASHLAEASITVTSLGDRGADSVIGVIHPPQVALVGFGAVRDDVWPDGGGVAVRPTVQATLAGDHRATDGLVASRFLAQVQSLLDGALCAALDDGTPGRAGQEVS